MGKGEGIVGNRQWAAGSGQQAVDSGQAAGNGQLSTDYCLLSLTLRSTLTESADVTTLCAS